MIKAYQASYTQICIKLSSNQSALCDVDLICEPRRRNGSARNHRSHESCTSHAILGAFGTIADSNYAYPWIAIGVRRGKGRRSLSRSSKASQASPGLRYVSRMYARHVVPDPGQARRPVVWVSQCHRSPPWDIQGVLPSAYRPPFFWLTL